MIRSRLVSTIWNWKDEVVLMNLKTIGFVSLGCIIYR